MKQRSRYSTAGASEPGQSRITASLGHVLAVATLVQVFATASVLALTGIGLLVSAEIGLDAHWIGYQISLIYAAGMVSSALAGRAIERFGASRTEQIAIACAGFGFFGLATGRLDCILAATVLIGLGYGLNNPAASQLLSRVTPPQRRNLIFSIKQSGVPLGGIFASVALPFVAQLFGWRTGLLCGAAVSFLLWFWLAYGHPDTAPAGRSTRSIVGDLKLAQLTLWQSPPLRTLSILGFLYSALQLSMSAFAVISLVEGAGWSVLSAGAVAAAMQLAGAIGRISWGVIADVKDGGFATLAVIGLVTSVCCIALFWIADLPAVAQFTLFIVMGFTSIGWNGVLLAEIAKHAEPSQTGPMTGAIMIYTFLGVMVGPSGFGLIFFALHDYRYAFLCFSCTGLVGAILGFKQAKAG